MLSVAEVGRLFDDDTRKAIANGLCVTCRAAKLLCGKPRCPILVQYDSMMKTTPLIDDTALDGSSPPGVFVGRFGYPKVFVGPLIPPLHGDTEILDTPEKWIGRSLDEVVGFRSQLVRAKPAVLDLYREGVPVSKIQRAFSVGAFGLEKDRRFVPTRWSITAVDDTIGKDLRERVKMYPLVNDVRVYQSEGFDDRFLILLVPRPWRYELIEAWYPNTLWNPLGREIVMFGDSEGFEGRTEYASIGGCYYAARLAVAEALDGERRQGAAVILRETHPGYLMPLGVWNVREHVREALRNEPRSFATPAAAMEYLATRLDIPMDRWIRTSDVLRHVLYQRALEDFSEGR